VSGRPQQAWRPRQAPPERIEVGAMVIRRYTVDDAATLHHAITSSVEHLRPFMPWIADEPRSLDDRRALIAAWDAQWRDRSDFVMGVFDTDQLVASTGLHPRRGAGVLEIGYWVRVDRIGHGIATRVVSAIATAATQMSDVASLEIHHDLANHASRRVAEKAGFVLVGEYDSQRSSPGDTGRSLCWERPSP
jgi:ribosomal-protein-serine acetyltransferase